MELLIGLGTLTTGAPNIVVILIHRFALSLDLFPDGSSPIRNIKQKNGDPEVYIGKRYSAYGSRK
jgi:hypothetical protein